MGNTKINCFQFLVFKIIFKNMKISILLIGAIQAASFGTLNKEDANDFLSRAKRSRSGQETGRYFQEKYRNGGPNVPEEQQEQDNDEVGRETGEYYRNRYGNRNRNNEENDNDEREERRRDRREEESESQEEEQEEN